MEVEGHEDKFFTHPLQLVRGTDGWWGDWLRSRKKETKLLYHSSSVFLNKIGRSQGMFKNKEEKIVLRNWEGTLKESVIQSKGST